MTLDYIAFFADADLLSLVENLDWSNGQAIDAFFHTLESGNKLTVWGQSTEAWPLNAITEWLKDKCGLQNFGSDSGRRLLTKCDFVHFVLGPSEIARVNERLKNVDAETDETFDGSIEEFFSDMGVEYVDSYLDAGMGEFYQIYNEMKADLTKHADQTLVIFIPG